MTILRSSPIDRSTYIMANLRHATWLSFSWLVYWVYWLQLPTIFPNVQFPIPSISVISVPRKPSDKARPAMWTRPKSKGYAPMDGLWPARNHNEVRGDNVNTRQLICLYGWNLGIEWFNMYFKDYLKIFKGYWTCLQWTLWPLGHTLWPVCSFDIF